MIADATMYPKHKHAPPPNRSANMLSMRIVAIRIVS